MLLFWENKDKLFNRSYTQGNSNRTDLPGMKEKIQFGIFS